MKKQNPVVHFEMPAEDTKRMSEFYTKAFGWKTHAMGEGYGGYIVAETTETKDSRPTTPGAINGGFYTKDKNMPAQFPSVVIAVDNIEEHVAMVTEAGGKILGEPTNIPGVGKYVSFLDTEGNRVSMLQPSSEM